MRLKREFAAFRLAFEPLTFYQKFEHLCVLVLTTLIAVVIVFAIWHLALKILYFRGYLTGFKVADAMALPFAGVTQDREKCELLLLQDSVKIKDDREALRPPKGRNWKLLWEGRRSSVRYERFRLYQRLD